MFLGVALVGGARGSDNSDNWLGVRCVRSAFLLNTEVPVGETSGHTDLADRSRVDRSFKQIEGHQDRQSFFVLTRTAEGAALCRWQASSNYYPGNHDEYHLPKKCDRYRCQ